MVFGMVHSARTLVVLLYNYFSLWLGSFSNYIRIITNCTYANVRKSLIMICQQFVHLFQVGLLCLNFSAVVLVFCRFWTYIVLGDVDLSFSLILATEAMLLKEELHQLCYYIANVISLHTWLMVLHWHHFLLASNTRQVWPMIVCVKSH